MQGFNMGRNESHAHGSSYVPPDLEGTASANQASGKKNAPGARGMRGGTQTVRFEMPFAVWCSGCKHPTLIGQGVRFNAEKKRVGWYHSTPIWAFRIRHADCGAQLEIRTDPANTEYVVHEGGKRRDTGEDREEQEPGPILTEAEREHMREDAFAKLEVTIKDRKQAETDKARIEELYGASERDWADPFAANKRLRGAFRVERKAREAADKEREAVRERMGLGMELLEFEEEDLRRAKAIVFARDGSVRGQDVTNGEGADGDRHAIESASSRAMFPDTKAMQSSSSQGIATEAKRAASPNILGRKHRGSQTATAAATATTTSSKQTPLKTSTKAQQSKEAAKRSLRAELQSNSRLSMDVFGSSPSSLAASASDKESPPQLSSSASLPSSSAVLDMPLLKRKRSPTATTITATATLSSQGAVKGAVVGLVVREGKQEREREREREKSLRSPSASMPANGAKRESAGAGLLVTGYDSD